MMDSIGLDSFTSTIVTLFLVNFSHEIVRKSGMIWLENRRQALEAKRPPFGSQPLICMLDDPEIPLSYH